jgi:hypothetical protein
MNKRGSLFDLLFYMMVFFTFGIITIICYYIYDKYSTATADTINSPVSLFAMNQLRDTLLSFDYIFVFLIAGMTILTVVSAFRINDHPLFFWGSLLFLTVLIMVSAIYSNVYDDLTSDTTLNTSAAHFTIIDWFMDKLPTLILFVGIIMLVVMYSRTQSEPGGTFGV